VPPRRSFAFSFAAVLAAGVAQAQQIPHTPGQIPPYVDPNNPPFQLPPGPSDPLDRLYPGPLRPDAVPDRQSPVGTPFQRGDAVPRVSPPRSLPQGFTMTIRRDARSMAADALSRPRQVGEQLAACWEPPAPGSEVTIRVTFNRRGAVIGGPRVTYVKPGQGADRAAVTRSVRQAFARCAPLRFTADLGSAIAGRPFAFRLIAPDAARP
jgi:hypothetical protein